MSVVIKSASGITHEYLKFSGGEPHVVLSGHPGYDVELDAKIRDFNDLGELLAVTDAIRRAHPRVHIHLSLPYFPGARQDRPFPSGAFTLKVYADIINAQRYETVTVLDPHSDVTPALVERVVVRDFAPMAAAFVREVPFVGLIVPDAGAEKRVLSVAKLLPGDVRIIQAHKQRNPKTGRIERYEIGSIAKAGHYVVVDDICDGGATFLELAKGFKAAAPSQGAWGYTVAESTLDLWVTHGIFGRGPKELFEHYSRIGTTDSFFQSSPEWDAYEGRIQVTEVE